MTGVQTCALPIWHFSAEDKIRIVLEGLRGDDSIAELCRKEGIAQRLMEVAKMAVEQERR